MSTIEMYADQELPAIQIAWNDPDGTIRDFSSGWTATVKVVAPTAPATLILAKTTGITLAATSPNYTIEFTTADLATIVTAAPPGTSTSTVYALAYIRRDADSKDMVFRPGKPIVLRIYPAPA